MLLLLDEAPSIMTAFNGLSKRSGYRKKTPLQAYAAAKLTGVGAKDCGPCLQLAVDMAREDGIAEQRIEAILR